LNEIWEETTLERKKAKDPELEKIAE